MIGYLQGKLLKREEDRILLLAGHVGYDVILPAVVMASLQNTQKDDEISLYIYYHQTERQPKPVLIGFNTEAEKEFFQLFITVEAIGPLKAVKALDIPVAYIARAIEERDVRTLKNLRGIGARTAQKIVASLHGKTGRFALLTPSGLQKAAISQEFVQQVHDVLVSQLGHKLSDAKRMIADALARNSGITTPEELFEEVYRGQGSV
jgi:Holliday junction DNA helicase RuvA